MAGEELVAENLHKIEHSIHYIRYIIFEGVILLEIHIDTIQKKIVVNIDMHVNFEISTDIHKYV